MEPKFIVEGYFLLMYGLFAFAFLIDEDFRESVLIMNILTIVIFTALFPLSFPVFCAFALFATIYKKIKGL